MKFAFLTAERVFLLFVLNFYFSATGEITVKNILSRQQSNLFIRNDYGFFLTGLLFFSGGDYSEDGITLQSLVENVLSNEKFQYSCESCGMSSAELVQCFDSFPK